VLGEDEDYKLYIKINCSLCLGGQRGGIFMNCPYCDVDRKTFIEASFDTIKTNLKENLTKKKTKDLTDFLNNGTSSNNNYF